MLNFAARRTFVLVAIIATTAQLASSSSSAYLSVPPPPECVDDPLSLITDNNDNMMMAERKWNNTPENFFHPAFPDTPLESSRCDLQRIPLSTVDKKRFKKEFLEKVPVIFVADTPEHRAATDLFAQLTERDILLKCFSGHDITTSTANQHSYVKTQVPFSEYVHTLMKPQKVNVSGDDTKIHFGDNKHTEWEHFFEFYKKPTEYLYDAQFASLSFGLAASGTGVPHHTHGHVFAECFHGKKRWFFTKPNDRPRFESNQSMLEYVMNVLPTYTTEERSKLLECTLGRYDILYIPTHWYHATFNIGEAVFMSTFV